MKISIQQQIMKIIVKLKKKIKEWKWKWKEKKEKRKKMKSTLHYSNPTELDSQIRNKRGFDFEGKRKHA